MGRMYLTNIDNCSYKKTQQQIEAYTCLLADESLDLVISGDLGSANEFGELIAERLDIHHVPTANLRDRGVGVFAGLTQREIVENYPRHLFIPYWEEKNLDFAPPRGESIRQVGTRIALFLSDVKKHHWDKDLLIAGHRDTLQIVTALLLTLPLESARSFMRHDTEISIFDVCADKAVMSSWVEVDCLDGLNKSQLHKAA